MAITLERVQKAGEFLKAAGRDIDQAQYAYHVDGAPLDELMGVLARYQNADGGFRGLEVDIAAPESNPFATELALHICTWADVPREHPLLRAAVDHLERTQDGEGNWRFAPAIYEHPLAPWFQGWEWPNLNPSCTIAGLLRQLGLGSTELHARVERLFERLARVEDLTGEEYYGARPYAYYFLPEWEHRQRELYLSGVLWWLIRQAQNPELDGNHFFSYAPRPDVYTARMLPERILAPRLDMLEAEQQADGGWPTPYDPRWRGPVTVANLLVLRAFGRL